MKLKLEKDFKPISFDIMMPDEIARKRKLEEEKVRSEKERKIKAEKAKAKREELLEWKRKRNYKIALFSSLSFFNLHLSNSSVSNMIGEFFLYGFIFCAKL